jgi:hypothetical protein
VTSLFADPLALLDTDAPRPDETAATSDAEPRDLEECGKQGTERHHLAGMPSFRCPRHVRPRLISVDLIELIVSDRDGERASPVCGRPRLRVTPRIERMGRVQGSRLAARSAVERSA